MGGDGGAVSLHCHEKDGNVSHKNAVRFGAVIMHASYSFFFYQGDMCVSGRHCNANTSE